MEYVSRSPEETRQIAARLAAALRGGDVVALSGDLGAGKTTFVQGLARALGVAAEITSPTFTLMNVYSLVGPDPTLKYLVHIDTYRLKNEDELLAVGAEDYIGDPASLCLIEWPEKIPGLLRGKNLATVSLAHTDPATRTICITKKHLSGV
ncbi:MAG: hypothetical protein UY92_C0014G0057 [Candidatus Magasanikbacteria bacterium GW2011_GWA2_56_11]|uniref:tRNA threonylcarbamoyladenosine biosynthesis protein TsaE n=1 Tax=Candidatus Magasanikbacteria bacterium GW2011_GWA2_56_11 TaxID=1619044 RepID=A0A0G2AKG6_9BACT|nr:MAG: hypothetical protein UY92_C0014G0057 [Candidatus Magasanikbacteria bacterium GW2011_GWA2_56_11]